MSVIIAFCLSRHIRATRTFGCCAGSQTNSIAWLYRSSAIPNLFGNDQIQPQKRRQNWQKYDNERNGIEIFDEILILEKNKHPKSNEDNHTIKTNVRYYSL